MKSYSELWDTMVISLTPDQERLLDLLLHRIRDNKHKYAVVAHATKVPYEIIGTIHALEGNCDFFTHLHNGDPLHTLTYHVPKDRPIIYLENGSRKLSNFTWEESAIDAFILKSKSIPKAWTIESTCDFLERYNGLGYRNRGLNSPYLWSGTNHYTRGKYIADGVYNEKAVSKQVGACVLLSKLNYQKTDSDFSIRFYYGMRGELVVALQQILNMCLPESEKLVVDGWLGNKTNVAMIKIFGIAAIGDTPS